MVLHFFFFLLIHLFIPQGEAVCLCLCMHMWRSRDNLLKSVFFFPSSLWVPGVQPRGVIRRLVCLESLPSLLRSSRKRRGPVSFSDMTLTNKSIRSICLRLLKTSNPQRYIIASSWLAGSFRPPEESADGANAETRAHAHASPAS